MKRLVFLDSGVLIAAFRGNDEVGQKAIEIIDDPDVEFASSIFVKLETIPKAQFNKRKAEVEFYNEFFEGVTTWVEPTEEVAVLALDAASKHDLGVLDSLHIASAVKCQAHEFITIEKPTKPFHRVTNISVRFIAQ